MLFSPVYLVFGLVLRGEQARLVLALHHKVLILQRLLGKKKLTEALLIVRPETLVGWHRAIVRRHWRFLSRRKPGRSLEITPEMEQWVVRIARENPRMGYGKIAGEMRKLGFVRFGRSSVARILKRHGLSPERRRSVGPSWLQFLRHHGQFIWASDFATVTTATLRTYYAVFFLEIGTLRIIHWDLSTSPDEARVSQQLRNLSVVSDDLPRYLIHDRDNEYARHADSLLEDAGTKVTRLPVRSPDLNGYAERWIRSLRQECLDRIIILNEAHLRWVPREYVRYHNQRRPHQALQQLAPEAPEAYPCEGSIVARPLLGGLISQAFRNQPVGVRAPDTEGLVEVPFCHQITKRIRLRECPKAA